MTTFACQPQHFNAAVFAWRELACVAFEWAASSAREADNQKETKVTGKSRGLLRARLRGCRRRSPRCDLLEMSRTAPNSGARFGSPSNPIPNERRLPGRRCVSL